MIVTKDNVINLIDSDRLQIATKDGWETVRRVGSVTWLNGRIFIDFAFGKARKGRLTENDFVPHGELNHRWRGLEQ